jgi:prepilin signal peptidase PulO-like enzyme (type II secretory pathway)
MPLPAREMILICIGGILLLIGAVKLETRKMPDWMSFLGIMLFPLWVLIEALLELKEQTIPAGLIMLGLIFVVMGFLL